MSKKKPVKKKAPKKEKVMKVEIQEKVVDFTPEPDKFKKTPALEEQKIQEEKEAKKPVEKPVEKVEKPNKKRTEVLEAEIKELEEKIEDKKVEISKEKPMLATLEGETKGFKKPSLSTLRRVHTYAEMKRIVDAYWISHPDMETTNPDKYNRKRSELAEKLRKLK